MMTVAATVCLIILVGAIVTLLLIADSTHAATANRLAERINDLLPQTQCQRCQFAGCLPYAQAIAQRSAPINQCPPGGASTIRALAELLGEEVVPLDPARGEEGAAGVVVIDEDVCIGCVKCITACPVDAIVGAPRLMHTVIAAECTGCALCIPVCPVDCISVVAATAQAEDWKWPRPANHG